MNVERKSSMRPRPITWLKHSLLLVITTITCTFAGVLAPFGVIDWFPSEEAAPDASFFDFAAIAAVPGWYVGLVGETLNYLVTNSAVLSYGLKFSLSLMFIIVAHEMGHYVACRLYKVDATLPYFIPMPPLFGPAGTLGAFIRIVSPMPSRKAVFDIGVAGPLAGFFALLPIAVLMILTTETVPLQKIPEGSAQFVFADPLLIKILAFGYGLDLSQAIIANPFYSAVWVGLLITALNLIPSGQLDGGHAIYAVFGKKFHRWTGYIAFVVMAILSVVGFFVFNSPAGILFAVILAIMIRVGHPRPPDETPLDKKRIAVAILTLIVFILCFVPFPIKVIYS